jgi:hypothetical protein
VAYPVSYATDIEVFTPGVKRLKLKAGLSPPSRAEVKNVGVLPPHLRLHGVKLNELSTR